MRARSPWRAARPRLGSSQSRTGCGFFVDHAPTRDPANPAPHCMPHGVLGCWGVGVLAGRRSGPRRWVRPNLQVAWGMHHLPPCCVDPPHHAAQCCVPRGGPCAPRPHHRAVADMLADVRECCDAVRRAMTPDGLNTRSGHTMNTHGKNTLRGLLACLGLSAALMGCGSGDDVSVSGSSGGSSSGTGTATDSSQPNLGATAPNGPVASPGPVGSPGPTGSPGPVASPGPADSPGPVASPGPADSPGPVVSPGPADSPGTVASPGPAGSPGPADSPGPVPSPGSEPLVPSKR